jgi:hypothetical protein
MFKDFDVVMRSLPMAPAARMRPPAGNSSRRVEEGYDNGWPGTHSRMAATIRAPKAEQEISTASSIWRAKS